jgi:hypothetical protein
MDGKASETTAPEVKPAEAPAPAGLKPPEEPAPVGTLPGTPAPDPTGNTLEFASANEKAVREFILGLTPEKASEILEDILNMGPDLEAAWECMGAPPPLPNPLPGPSLAILLEGKVSDEEP